MGGVLAEVPALPLHEAGKYVAGAYVVLFALVLIYVAIMAIRLSGIERELGELLELAERPSRCVSASLSARAKPVSSHASSPRPPRCARPS
jgi:hypothetical protein